MYFSQINIVFQAVLVSGEHMLVSIYLEVDVLQSNKRCTFLALLVGALQAEDVDQWEMWECQVSKYIDTGCKV